MIGVVAVCILVADNPAISDRCNSLGVLRTEAVIVVSFSPPGVYLRACEARIGSRPTLPPGARSRWRGQSADRRQDRKINQATLMEPSAAAENGLAVLTKREREIMRLASEGLSNKAIGRRLKIAEGTIKVHLHNIYRKLGINNRTMLAALAIRSGTD
jgi:DNA-binding NarL/FixJ family response regulator